MEITLVTRRSCHLCQDALEALRSLGVEPKLVDVDTDSRLFDLYDFRVPVVLVDGRPVSEGRISLEGLRGVIGPAGAVMIRPALAADAAAVHRLTLAAFGACDWLIPPCGALIESEAMVRAELEADGGAVAVNASEPVGALRWGLSEPGRIHVRRVAVLPGRQRSGIGRALMAWAAAEARSWGHREIRLGVREQLPANRAFYEALGYRVTGRREHSSAAGSYWLEMTLDLEAPLPPQ